MRTGSIALLIFCSLLSLSVQSKAQTIDADAGLKAIMEQYKAIGLSVAVVHKQKLIYAKSFGLKNVAANTALTNNCLFRIASISKSFTATAILKLAEMKNLSLADDVSNLLGFPVRNPNFPNNVITVQMLLAHRSGINDSQGYFSLDAINPEKNPDWKKCYNAYAPGTDYQYCNFNYNMAGCIIEKVSGKRFDVFMKEHILTPLQIDGGYCVDSMDATRFASLYNYNKAENSFTESTAAYAPRRDELANYRLGYSAPLFSPTGGLKISVIDLSKFMQMQMQLGKYNGKRLLKKKSVRFMQQKISEEDGYAVGMMNLKNLVPGRNLKGHLGIAYGLYSAMFFDEEEEVGFVVITNGCVDDEQDTIQQLIRRSIQQLYSSYNASKK